MSDITLRMALGTLAKSSSFSVATETKHTDDPLNKYKKYLYVEPDIEHDFVNCLDSIQQNEIVFLCGSSGDGKSEILTRYIDKYKHKCRFHLDATHSFAPSETAIDALNNLFDKQNIDGKPLVIGINIGMLANFSKEGAERHEELRESLERFLATGNRTDGCYHFLDFEAYPKFVFKDGFCHAPFIRKVLQQLSNLSDKNPYYKLLLQTEHTGCESILASNFRLLARASVQQAIITSLFKVRLSKNQFITTRALLDFLHDLLTRDKYLFDGLFTSERSELSHKLTEFDPALIHTQKLDQFALQYELGLIGDHLDIFLNALSNETGIKIQLQPDAKGQAASLIRLLYVLQGESLANDYHRQFTADFNENALSHYAHIWALHSQSEDEIQDKTALRNFYTREFIPAIVSYANRNAPRLGKRELFLGEFGTTLVSSPIELKQDLTAVQNCSNESVSHFMAFIKLGEKTLRGIEVNLNLFGLIHKINNGYCPNKYDKNAVLLLDDICDQLADIARDSSQLKIYDRHDEYLLRQEDDLIYVEVDF
ncbi:DNA phosphorothioation-dependent restriction protein DptF [Vibrio sp. E14]|uniref:DNA phosphorothioation-dependent restriction protein DptF n=1 Tax=Vibrio sp. E14 TaxID=2849869 RepID=UPI001CF8DAEF|nr:DNA phosphorothioation-dependent restriction protein DptF [Vibrio sp. E14]